MNSFAVVITQFPEKMAGEQDRLKYIQEMEQAEYELLKSPIESPEDNDLDNPTWRLGVPPALLKFYEALIQHYPDHGLHKEGNPSSVFKISVYEKFIKLAPGHNTDQSFQHLESNIHKTIKDCALNCGVDIWVFDGTEMAPTNDAA